MALSSMCAIECTSIARPSGVAMDLALSCVCGTSTGRAARPGPAVGALRLSSMPTGRLRSNAKVAWAFRFGSFCAQGIRAAERRVCMVIAGSAHARLRASLQL